jgi:hypothetical protein
MGRKVGRGSDGVSIALEKIKANLSNAGKACLYIN